MRKWLIVVLTLLLWVSSAEAKELSREDWLKMDEIFQNQGIQAYQEGNYKISLDYLQESLKIRKKLLGEEHADTAACYNNIGTVYQSTGDYRNALKFYQKALLGTKKSAGKNHPNTATSYNNIGTAYHYLGKYKKAIEYHLKALEIQKKVLGAEHLDTIKSYDNIGADYWSDGDYSKAISYYQKALPVREKVQGKEHIDTTQNYINIGLLYRMAGDYSNALKYQEKVLTSRKKVPGEEHPKTAETYSEIGELSFLMGNYRDGLKYSQKALAIFKKVLGDKHPYVAMSYNNIGLLYSKLGNYTKAMKYHKKALAIREKVQGKDHIDTATSYNNIALLYRYTERYEKALKYYKKSLAIKEKVLGKEHASTAISYSNICALYQLMGNYSKAIKYCQMTFAIREKVLGKEHTETTNSYNNFGTLYYKMGNYSKASDYFRKAMAIREKVLGKDHPDTANSYNNIGLAYKQMGRHSKSHHYSQLAFNAFLASRDKVFTILDSKQKEKYLKSTSGYITALLSASYHYINQLKKQKNTKEIQTTLQSGTNAWLNYKGSIFDSENAIAMLYASTKDKKLKAKIDDLVSSKRYLAKLYQSLPKPEEMYDWKQNIKNTEEKISKLTNDISSKASSFKEQQGLKSISYKDITSHLKDDELYIDYAKAGDYYYLFTLDKKNHIEFTRIDKKRTKKIDGLIKTFRGDINSILKGKNLTDKKLKTLTKNSKTKLSKLYNLLINIPLGKIIKDKISLIISPDGALRLLPFEVLYDREKGKYFIEEKEIRYIPSGKELVRLYKYSKNKVSIDKRSAVIFANPNFDSDLNSSKREPITITPNTSRTAIIKPLFMIEFPPLPGTKAEAKAIKSTFAEGSTIEYLQDDATESNLTKVKQPNILHIATHGFFINDNTIPNPMLKSGIALTGANKSRIKGVGDGIVTALKLSGLDLKGTDLVVLSACQTGVVDINSTDSVSGLSKAFIQAGAKDIVMSLWSVDDEATKELMSSFYQEMKQTKNYAEALKAAKLKMIVEGRHPFYWAAFVIYGL